MLNMKAVDQRNLKLLGRQGKTDGRPDVPTAGQPDGQADSSIPPLQLSCAGV
jgi:hypothetical protein